MANYEFTGTVTSIGETKSFGANNFQKREILVNDENTRYPQDVLFELTRDRIKLPEDLQLQAGDRVKITFDINCRAWNDRHFISLNAWKLERADVAAGGAAAGMPAPAMPPAAASAPVVAPAPAASAAPAANVEEVDDLPF